MAEAYNSRNADKFVVRLKEGQRERIARRANHEHRSMNDLFLAAIERYLEQGEAFDRLLSVAAEGLKQAEVEA